MSYVNFLLTKKKMPMDDTQKKMGKESDFM